MFLCFAQYYEKVDRQSFLLKWMEKTTLYKLVHYMINPWEFIG